MRGRLETDPEAFAERVLPFLRTQPVEHNVMATVLAGAGPDTLRAYVEDGDGAVAAVAVRVPAMPLLVSTLTDDAAAAALAEALRGAGVEPSAVTGPEPAASVVAHTLDPDARPRMRMGTFALEAVRSPERPASGSGRVARPAERDLLVRWANAMAREAGVPPHGQEYVDRRLGGELLWVWEVDGVPVSVLGQAELVEGVMRISLVYTPEALRGRGYATSLVAWGSESMLRRGARRCMLHTDLANPTANAIYQAVGYRRVADAGEWTVRATAGS